MQISRIPQQTLNNQYNKNNQQNVFVNHTNSTNPSFTGNAIPKSKVFEPIKKLFAPVCEKYTEGMTKITDKMAHGFAYLADTKVAEKLVNSKFSKDPNLVTHLMVFTSLVLSSFYVKQTLDNKKLDSDKKMTLAINQGVVAIFSAICSYAVEASLNKKVKQLTEKFKQVNAGDVHLKKYVTGIDVARKVIIISTMYRFVVPVFVTPLANAIGNRVQAKKEAAKKQAALTKGINA